MGVTRTAGYVALAGVGVTHTDKGLGRRRELAEKAGEEQQDERACVHREMVSQGCGLRNGRMS